jgi:hypothetical protein
MFVGRAGMYERMRPGALPARVRSYPAGSCGTRAGRSAGVQ